MRPIRINLKKKSDTGKKIRIGVILILIALASGMTVSNVYDYYSNLKIVDEYQQRLAAVEQNTRQMALNRNQISPEERASIHDAGLLQSVLEKHFVSFPAVLTELENLKPDKLKFDEVNFFESNNGKYGVSIRGSSDNAAAVFQFLKRLNKSSRFVHTLSQEKMTERRKMEFKLTAEWLHETQI